MSIRGAIRSHLMADPAVAPLVAARIYPMRLPQSPVLPALTIQLITGRWLISHSGRNSLRPGERYQVDCWSKTADGAEALAEAVVDAIGAFRGTWGTVPIGASLISTAQEDFDTGSGLYRQILDFLITYREV